LTGVAPAGIGLRTATLCASAVDVLWTVIAYLRSSPGGASAATRTMIRTTGAGGSTTGEFNPCGRTVAAAGIRNCAGVTAGSSITSGAESPPASPLRIGGGRS
jgi:hypothetical protein